MADKVKSSGKKPRLAIRGYLLHLTHYDPQWVLKKNSERPFDLGLAMEIADELAGAGFNALLVGVSDGVRYKSHPEFRRKYSVPMKQLETLCKHARSLGLEIIPKLNFSRSAINRHNDWMLAPKENWYVHFDDDYYWKTGFEAIDEVIAACRPKRFFHVGMDEDHDRSYTQYVDAILRLRAGLKKRGRDYRASTAQVLEQDFACPSRSLFCGVQRGTRSDGWRDDQLPRRIRYWTDDLQLLLGFVHSGQALAYLPDFALHDPHLARIQVSDCAYTCSEQAWLVWDRSTGGAWQQELSATLGDFSPHGANQ